MMTFPGAARVHASLPPLNSTASSRSNPGQFEWADLITGDIGRAEQFYTDLLGWTATAPQTPKGYTSEKTDTKHPYVLLYSNGTPVAGLVGRTAASDRPGRWIPYVAVSSIGHTTHLIATLNGEVVSHPRTVPDRGRQAIVRDPKNAIVGILQSSSGDLAGGREPDGQFTWFELFSSDPKGASRFYQAAFGYGFENSPSGPADHYVLTVNDQPVAGIEALPSDAPHASDDWVGFVRVSNLDEKLAKVSSLGGTVIEPAQSGAANTRFALVSDPTGGVFGLVEFLSTP
ncbi:MAG TPA: VOC family protein [Opitutaceae bacterium]|jgi:hypothetical protein